MPNRRPYASRGDSPRRNIAGNDDSRTVQREYRNRSRDGRERAWLSGDDRYVGSDVDRTKIVDEGIRSESRFNGSGKRDEGRDSKSVGVKTTASRLVYAVSI